METTHVFSRECFQEIDDIDAEHEALCQQGELDEILEEVG